MSDMVVQAPPTLRRPSAAWIAHGTAAWAAIPWARVSDSIYEVPLFADAQAGVQIALAKVERGAEIPEHFHSTAQTLFLVAGRLRTRTGQWIHAGTFCLIPACELHGPFVAEEDSLLLSINR